MALNTFKYDYLTPQHFKGLAVVRHHMSVTQSSPHICRVTR